jgi:hypothetical protein
VEETVLSFGAAVVEEAVLFFHEWQILHTPVILELTYVHLEQLQVPADGVFMLNSEFQRGDRGRGAAGARWCGVAIKK